jgi:beta-galactosidase/beta-glucuronidase
MKNNRKRLRNRCLVLFIAGLFFSSHLWADEKSYIIPSSNAGVKQSCISLNGSWQFQFSPESKWTMVEVPGEVAMQGYGIQHDKPFRYRKSVDVPADYRNKTVILRFNGVYSHARLWVNGVFVREHHGGFTRWDTDVTDCIKTGKKNVIELEVTDRADEISYVSGYAHHPVGGILREVILFALPQTHIYDFHVETLLDSIYRNAILKLSYLSAIPDGATIVYTLTAPDGNKLTLTRNSFPLSADGSVEKTDEIAVDNPLKWDAEHPNLYTLTVAIVKAEKELSRFSQKVGFRDIKIVKDRLLVNGHPVKLRGACRHDIHPTLGRMTTPELDSLDAVLYKKSNMNFVRTSHYPPSETFVNYCDKLGIYVESEAAVCFVTTHRQKNYPPAATQSDTAFTGRYLGQFREMVKTFRSHPAVLFWSLGNESMYGDNFRLCSEWIRATDKTRPSIFSYPGQQKDGERIYDILSMHYPDVQGNLSQYDMITMGFRKYGIPALFDEWAHVPCYTYNTLQHDPNIREFWGASLDMMWERIFRAQGGLGGAIWGFIDETFMLPEPAVGNAFWKEFTRREGEMTPGNCAGYGEWGIIDVWRREKPEFWATKKAYSPVRLLTKQVKDFTPGERLLLPVHNRFDHTNLDEIKIQYTYRGKEKEIKAMSVAPHQQGLQFIPGDEWADGEQLFIRFVTQQNELIDAELVVLGREKTEESIPKSSTTALTVENTPEQLIVKGKGFTIPFDKRTGLITNAASQNETVIEKGPFLHIDAGSIIGEEDWKMHHFDYKQTDGQVVVNLSGAYRQVSVNFRIRISPQGQLVVDYATEGEKDGQLRESGLKFYLPQSIESLTWKRKGYWSYYPDDAFAGNEGTTALYNSHSVAYGDRPGQDWSLDDRNYFYWSDAGANSNQPLTQKAKGMKENIYRYTLVTQGGKGSVSILSADASVACRINKPAGGQLVLYANNQWDYPEIGWGDYSKNISAKPCFGRLELRF